MRLHPDPRNSHLHTEIEIDETAAAIREWGWTFAILIDDADRIIAGERRWRAARKLGIAEVPVIIARGWSEQQKRAYAIADNMHAKAGRFDDTLLALELGDLGAAGFNLGLIGLSAADKKRIAGEDAEGLTVQQISTTPVADEFWISIRGPLKHQADALARMRKVLADLDGVSVDLGTIKVD
jgi:ParB-like chromosome segregation protein Spo0J